MVLQNKQLINPATGQEIIFLQTGRDTGGALLSMESVYHKASAAPPDHYHPYQTEDFTVLSGELSVRIDGNTIVLKQGDALHVPRGKHHAMWNALDGVTSVSWKVQPAMETEAFLKTIMGLAADGKTNKAGRPGLLQTALTAGRYQQVLRLAKPAFAVQKILFALLRPLALLTGHRASYKKYL